MTIPSFDFFGNRLRLNGNVHLHAGPRVNPKALTTSLVEAFPTFHFIVLVDGCESETFMTSLEVLFLGLLLVDELCMLQEGSIILVWIQIRSQ